MLVVRQRLRLRRYTAAADEAFERAARKRTPRRAVSSPLGQLRRRTTTRARCTFPAAPVIPTFTPGLRAAPSHRPWPFRARRGLHRHRQQEGVFCSLATDPAPLLVGRRAFLRITASYRRREVLALLTKAADRMPFASRRPRIGCALPAEPRTIGHDLAHDRELSRSPGESLAAYLIGLPGGLRNASPTRQRRVRLALKDSLIRANLRNYTPFAPSAAEPEPSAPLLWGLLRHGYRRRNHPGSSGADRRDTAFSGVGIRGKDRSIAMMDMPRTPRVNYASSSGGQ